MTISISNLIVQEATPGIAIGTLSTDATSTGTFSLYHDSNNNFLQIHTNTLSLKPNFYIDFETKNFIHNTSLETNGRITQRSYTSYSTTSNAGDDPIVLIKFTADNGSEEVKQFTLTIENKVETISVSPDNFKQNQYGATIAQINPTDNYFSGRKILFEGPSFLELVGSNLKFTKDYYYSETGWVLNNSGVGWNLSASDYSSDLNFVISSGLTTSQTDADGDGSPDNGYTKLSTSNYLSSIFSNSNILIDQKISLIATPFVERDFGTILAKIDYSGTENISFSIANHSFFELVDNDKIKLKDSFFYNKSEQRIEDQNGISGGTIYPLALQNASTNPLIITATNNTNGNHLYTENITIGEMVNTVFASSNVDGTPLITIQPVSFNDKKFGAIIGNVNYSGSETAKFILNDHPFLEITNSNKLKLKDTFCYDLNTGRVIKEDLSGYTLSDISTNNLTILSQDVTNSKNLSLESISIGDLINPVFGKPNVTDLDQSYTFVTDLKFQVAQLPITGRKEYQKNITSNWMLDSNEKISYSFLKPGASYVGTYNELDGLITIEEPFKTATREAFNTIASFANITFEEINETGNIVGDFRIGITDANHFGMSSEFAAYSQGVSNSPNAGNIFFNGGIDKNTNNIPDYNESDTFSGKSRAFTTLLHEIIHSLGHKHPFEVIDSTNTNEGNANIYQNEYEQYPYSIMSYTPLRDKETYSIKYEGVNLSTGGKIFPTTPMLFDIMALQEIYGATTETKSGNDTYTFTPNSLPFECIYDTAGEDTLDLNLIKGGATLDLSGNKISTIGDDYLIPWKNVSGGPTVYGKAQGAPLGIIPGSEIEKVILPTGNSIVTSGSNSSFLVGNANSSISVDVTGSEIGVKSNGSADDIINLKQTTIFWNNEFEAVNMGNDGIGATGEKVIDMSIYLKHDLSLDLQNGIDTIKGTNGNDAIFLQNFGTTGDKLFFKDSGSLNENPRLSGINQINLSEGKNFLDLTSTTTSLLGESITITAGTNDDILWLSDANENVNSGNGNDQITVNGGTDILATSLGSDIITVSKNTGNLTITDFDTSKDKFKFLVTSEKVSASGNVITVNNEGSLGNYIITLSNNPDLTDLSLFSSFV